jgi:aspartate/methionine/tyrosine aminotransferase
MSLGLIYPPGMYASEDELMALYEVLVEKRVWYSSDKVYTLCFPSHTRGYAGTATRPTCDWF